jgi:hypothetical protein
LTPGTKNYRQALNGLGESWSTKNPAAAADFALQLPATPERQHILRQSAEEWAIAHPDRATEWLAKYQRHPDYDYVVAAVATTPRNTEANFSRAIGWADTIRNDELRLNSLTRIMEQWATRDPDSARKFLAESATLTPAIRGELLNRLKSVGTLAK